MDKTYAIELTAEQINHICGALNTHAKQFENIAADKAPGYLASKEVWQDYAKELYDLTRNILKQKNAAGKDAGEMLAGLCRALEG